MENAIKLIVGLGNPGPQYVKTRHNVGFWFVDALVDKFDGCLQFESKFKGNFGSVVIANQECKLLQPSTFMNLSGQSVLAVARFYKIPPEEILIAHDELDFASGIIRLKKGGGANGHNGVQSIISCIGSSDFCRLRVGISRPTTPQSVSDYVLEPPSKTDQEQILTAIDDALSILPLLLTGKIEAAMQLLHSSA